MSRLDELFNRAYELHVVEERHREAIELCNQALEENPDNYRVRVFLGMLLGDHGSAEEIIASRHHFIEAIRRASTVAMFCTTWPEEAAIQHLGLWEWHQAHYYDACLFLLIDYLACNNKDSYRYLLEILNELNPSIATDIKFILERLNSGGRTKPAWREGSTNAEADDAR